MWIFLVIFLFSLINKTVSSSFSSFLIWLNNVGCVICKNSRSFGYAFFLTTVNTTRKIFLRDIEKLKKSVLIVMDNARFHRKRILEKIIKEARYCLLFLPPYSSNLNLIKKVMASLKKKLKDIAHNFNTLLNKLYYK